MQGSPWMLDCHGQEGMLITALIFEPSADTWHLAEAHCALNRTAMSVKELETLTQRAAGDLCRHLSAQNAALSR